MTSRRNICQSIMNMPLAALALASAHPAWAQKSPSTEPGTEMLTVFLRHDESKTLSQINEQLKGNGWYRDFPPQGIEVVSWYVLMGIGQVVTLRFPAERLREINRLFEDEAWGAYRTEFYATYDYRALYQAEREKNMK